MPALIAKPAPRDNTIHLVDARARFRAIFQAVSRRYAQTKASNWAVESALWVGEDEAPALQQTVYLGAPRLDLHYVIITGLVADCLSHRVTPFHKERQCLHQLGFMSSVLTVNGRASSGYNAALIQQVLTSFPAAHRFVLLGYSKGAVDALHALVTYPSIRQRTVAVVSLAGAIGGSPLVEILPRWLKYLFARLPLPDCHPGDGKALDSLARVKRRQWLSEHVLPPELAYFSLVALPRPEQVSRILRFNYRQLAKYNPKNDSQVLAEDALIPGSELLGYVNADHWALTLPLTKQWPFLRFFLNKNDYPREILLESIVRYVEERLLARIKALDSSEDRANQT